MSDSGPCILTINAGSSSVKFGLFDVAESPNEIMFGNFDVTVTAPLIAEQVVERIGSRNVIAIGHRIVHGGPEYYVSAVIDDRMLKTLRELELFDAEHLPMEIKLIEAFRAQFPDVPHVACFDTAFHHDLPRVARVLPIPRKYEAEGMRRYGFHGLSYSFLVRELGRLQGSITPHGRVVIAHLGSGVSLAAVRDGKSVDTSMAFTPVSGVPMSTRSGDLDPGLAWYFAQKENMSISQFNEMITRASGLLGISETSGDMKTLLEQESIDPRAAEAIAVFCYQIKKYIGAYAAALGGLDSLIFAGGIGEGSPEIRSRICEDLQFLGIAIDMDKNEANAGIISKDGGAATVFVIKTNEERIIAEETNIVIQHITS